MLTRALLWTLPALVLAAPGCGSGPAATAGRPAAGPLAVRSLRCEYAVNPLGIDVAKPRLSWVLESSQRGTMQAAYQVQVASVPAKLEAGEADLWDSGRVASDRSIQVEYAGKPLGSGARAWWRVRVFAADGRASAWSAPAWWEAGLTKSEDWTARWISLPSAPAKESLPSLDGATWIWAPEGEPAKSAPAGDRYFRRTFELPKDRAVAAAWLAVAADDTFGVWVNGLPAARGNYRNQVYHFDVTVHLAAGPNLLAVAVNNAKGPAGLVARLHVAFASGDPLIVTTDKGWKAGSAGAGAWETAGLDDAAWPAAQELVAFGQAPWEKTKVEAGVPMGPVPFLRKPFALAKPVARARLYATALGIYELRLNGRRVGDEQLAPGWTDYRKRVQVQAHDVTALVRAGENVLGAALAEGWYAGYIGWGGQRNHYGGVPALLAQLRVEYADGTSETVGTDGTWTGAVGPILGADLLMGETYDARRQVAGWDAPGFAAAGWRPAQVREDVRANLVAQVGPPVRKLLEVPAKTVHEPRPGVFVFDLGQNLVGWVRLQVKGPAGTRVVLRHAEMLNPDKTLYLTNLRSARATDVYVCAGTGGETWEPRFTFHGFRYVEVTGYPGGKPPLDAVTGVVLYSDTPPTGTFACSNPMINQLQSNIVWGQRGNFVSIPTDCPQRDERMGWMGDAQIFVRTACFNMDVAGFFTKWMDDVVDAQGPTGAFYDVSPRYVGLAEGTPAWADAGVIVPWTIYLCYGDTRILARHYDAMAKWIEYVRSINPDLVWLKKRGNDYGDWVSVLNSRTPKEVLATAFFANSTRLVARAAKVLGKAEDARKYEALFGQIRDAFNKAFVAADGRVKGDTQTCYALPIRFDLLSPEHRAAAGRYLVENVEKHQGRLTTGFLGVAHLLPALTETGHLDLAYRLYQNDVYPSWGYSIGRGATTIWERWDGWTEEKGFQDPGMNSFNHYSFGSVSEWMTTVVTGIEADPERPGYKHVVLRPRPGGGLSRASATLESIHGTVASEWTLDGKQLAWKTIVPANTTATVFVPAAGADGVKEGGKPAAQAEGVKFLRMEDRAAVYEVGSGTYAWESEMP